MSKLTKKPKRPVLSHLSKTLVAGVVVVAGCGDDVGVSILDSGPDTMDQEDALVGVPPAPEDAGADVTAPPPGVPPAEDAGPDVSAPPPGVPPVGDAGPDEK